MIRYIILIFLTFIACNTDKKIKDKGDKSIEIIQDSFFINGVAVQKYTTAQPEAIGYLFPFGENEKTTHWSLAQRGSHNTFSSPPFTIQDDTNIYQNEAKCIYFHPQKDKSIQLWLEAYASKEYLKPRKFDEDWVHLLFEQNFTNPIFLKDIKL